MNAPELNRTVTLSLAAVIMIITATFFMTKFYLTQSTLEQRMDKRYQRIEKQIERLEERLRSVEG